MGIDQQRMPGRGRAAAQHRVVSARLEDVQSRDLPFGGSGKRQCNLGGQPRIAAKVPRTERSYFKELEPQIDGRAVELVGEVNDRRKEEFLAGAAALLFPIKWPEPFGLVMIEAMACRTPVIAYRAGSVPEIVDHGINGFIVKDQEEAATAVGRISLIDRRQVRASFERRFTARRMAEQYVQHYKRLTGVHSAAAAKATA